MKILNRTVFLSIIMLLFLCTALSARLHRAPLEGMVDHSMKHFVTRVLDSVSPEDTVLFTIDSDGGRLDAAFAIGDTLFSSPVTTIAYVERRALSAAALIALACDSIFMTQGSTLGDMAPIIVSQEGPQELGEKIQSPLRAKLRAYARASGYDPLLAESMISKNIRVYQMEKEGGTYTYIRGRDYDELSSRERERGTLIIDETQLLTMTDEEASARGFSRGSYGGVRDFMEKEELSLSGSHFKLYWSEKMASFIAGIGPILMALGMAGLFIESKSPGIGIPGILGAVFLILVFGAQSMVGLAAHTELVILMIGAIFLLAEIFIIPGFGIAGLTGIFFIALAGVLAFQGFVIPDPSIPWESEILYQNMTNMFFALLGSLIIILLFFKYLFPRVSSLTSSHMILNQNSDGTNIDTETARSYDVLKGKTATVVKGLHPTGAVEVDGHIYDATSRDFFIEAGKKVIVQGKSGMYLLVSKIEGE
ncbi:MAG: NfeD family protein [Fibrobacterota bacterium]